MLATSEPLASSEEESSSEDETVTLGNEGHCTDMTLGFEKTKAIFYTLQRNCVIVHVTKPVKGIVIVKRYVVAWTCPRVSKFA